MAASSSPPSPTNNAVVLSVCLIVGILIVIILAAVIMLYCHPQAGPTLPLLEHIQQLQQSQHKKIDVNILGTLPVLKLDDALQRRAQRGGEARTGGGNENGNVTGNVDLKENENGNSNKEAIGVDLEAAQEQLTCPICTSSFQPADDVRLLSCAHIYHPRCIDPWLLGFSDTCPLCRSTMQDMTSENVNFAIPAPERLETNDRESRQSTRLSWRPFTLLNQPRP